MSNYLFFVKKYVIPIIFILLFGLSIYGWIVDKNQSIINAIYQTLKFLTLDGDGGDSESLYINIARVGLPLFTMGAVFNLIWRSFSKYILFFRLRINPRTKIIFGTTKTLTYLSEMEGLNKTLFVDLSEKKEIVQNKIIGEIGLFVHENNIDVEFLMNIRITNPKEIYIFTDNDELNITLAKKIIPLITKRSINLFIKYENKEIAKIRSQEDIFLEYRKHEGKINWFSENQQSARILLRHEPPLVNSSLSLNGNNIHIGIIGFTDFSKELILSLARNCIYLNDSFVFISIFSNKKEKVSCFLDKNPILKGEETKEFGEFNLHLKVSYFELPESGILFSTFRDSINIYGDFCKLYISATDDFRTLNYLQRVNRNLCSLNKECNVVACIPGSHFTQSEIISLKSKPQYNNAIFFIVNSKNMNVHYNKISDLLGKSVHVAYSIMFSEKFIKLEKNREKFMEAFWESFNQEIEGLELLKDKYGWDTSLSEESRDSSKYSSDHFFIKVREMGYVIKEKLNENNIKNNNSTLLIEQLEKDIENNIDSLNKLEHKRFCYERFISGWIYGEKSNKVYNVNHTLVPFEKLDLTEKYKDEVVIKSLPIVLKTELMQKYYYLEKLV